MNVLIVDDENEIVEILDFLVHDKFPFKVQTFFAKNATEAIELLKNSEIDLCICDHNMLEEKGSQVLKYIIDEKLKAKFVLCSTVLPKDATDIYPPAHLFFNIVKPDVFGGIEKLVVLFPNIPSEEKVDAAELYVPISINFLHFLEKTPADIYIKVSDSKYLKCFESNADFNLEDKEKYLNKSLTNLYCRNLSNKPTTESIILRAIEKIMLKNDLPLSDRMEIAHSQLTELIKFTGMTPELSEVIKENINQTTVFIAKNALLNDFWKKINLKGEYPANLYTLHTMLASVILKKLQWNTEATFFKLTLAAFFQDITLDSVALMKLYDYSDFLLLESNLTRPEIKNYLDHSIKASELISSIKNMPPDIDKIILEQHEMPDGSGFPRKLPANKLGPLTCTFILSGILARYILNEGEKFNLQKFIEIFEARGYNKGNFKAIFEIIRNMHA
jgi:response regulator RpfG family c-di-GMP phosphodiesterase